MCLHLKENDHHLIKIADSNIFVFKYTTMNNCSEFEGYKYLKNKLNPHVDISVSPNSNVYLSSNYPFRVYEGYHSWKSRSGNSLFVIPKGVKYAEGIQHNLASGYVSENIIYLGKFNTSVFSEEFKIDILMFKFKLKSWLKDKLFVLLK